MSGRTDHLDELRRAAEAAAGAMRDVADHLDGLADHAPRRAGKLWRVDLERNAGRLRAAADMLVAEVNVDSAATAGTVARIARSALAFVTLLAPAAASGATGAAVSQLLASRDRAAACIAVVESEATTATAALEQSADAELEEMRRWLETVIRHPNLAGRVEALPASELDALRERLTQPRLGMPASTLRERMALLDAIMSELDARPPDSTDSGRRMDALRRLVELAEPDSIETADTWSSGRWNEGTWGGGH